MKKQMILNSFISHSSCHIVSFLLLFFCIALLQDDASENEALAQLDRSNSNNYSRCSSELDKTGYPDEPTEVYNNTTNGIYLQYPSDWYYTNENKSYVEFHPISEGNNSRTGISIESFPVYGPTLYEIISNEIKYYKINKTGFEIINSTSETSVGNFSLLYRHKDLVHNLNYKTMENYCLIDNTIYRIRYVEETSQFPDFLPVLENMFKSLEFKLRDNTKQAPTPGFKVGNIPASLEINPITNMLYVANFGSNGISVIDTRTNTIVKNITVQSRPNDVSLTTVDNSIYVANSGSNTVSAIDGMTNNVTANILVGKTPAKIAVDPDLHDRLVFVSNIDSDSISVIDGQAAKRVKNIPVGKSPFGLAVNPIINRLYVANSNSNKISVIDYFFEQPMKFKVTDSYDITVGLQPNDIAVDPLMNRVYVANAASHTISVIDASTNRAIKNITLGDSPNIMDINPNSKVLLVNRLPSNSISIINSTTNKITETISLDYRPAGITINPITNIAYLSNDLTNTVYVLKINTDGFNVTAGITFKINPPNAGYVSCNIMDGNNDDKNYTNNDYNLFDYNATLECTAKRNNGFNFVSWSGLVDPSKEDREVANIVVTQYGTLSANFEKTEESIQQSIAAAFEQYREFWWALITSAILGPIIGWIIPFIFAQKDKKRQLRYLKVYIPLIDKLYVENRYDREDCLQLLEQKRTDITALLNEGLLSDTTYRILNERISDYVYKIATSK